MLTIRVRYYSPTATRGAKLVATDGQRHLRVAYTYTNDAAEKLAAAKEFVRIHLKHAPELLSTPSEFNGDSFYQFKPKTDIKKVQEAINQTLAHYNLINPNVTHSLNREQLITMLNRAILTYNP